MGHRPVLMAVIRKQTNAIIGRNIRKMFNPAARFGMARKDLRPIDRHQCERAHIPA
jgi:hypothetical protein